MDSILISGISNEVNLNKNCGNIHRTINGIENKLSFEGIENANSNNINENNNTQSNSFNRTRSIRVDPNITNNEGFYRNMNTSNNFNYNFH